MCPQSNHRLDGKAHAWLRLSHGLVLGIMRNIRRTMKQAVDTVTAVCFDDTAIFRLGELFYHVSVIPEKSSRLDELDSFIQALSSSFNDTHRIRVCLGLISNIVCFV